MIDNNIQEAKNKISRNNSLTIKRIPQLSRLQRNESDSWWSSLDFLPAHKVDLLKISTPLTPGTEPRSSCP